MYVHTREPYICPAMKEHGTMVWYGAERVRYGNGTVQNVARTVVVRYGTCPAETLATVRRAGHASNSGAASKR